MCDNILYQTLAGRVESNPANRGEQRERMTGTIMRIGFRVSPPSVFCLTCNEAVGTSLDALPRCDRCDSAYCPLCLKANEPSLRCARDFPDYPLGLPASNAPAEE